MERDRRVYCAQGPEHLAPINPGRLDGLSFVFKDLFDVEGYITGAGNPKWLDTHGHAQNTAPLILDLLSDGAFCKGRVHTDELAYSLNGINTHYGTPLSTRWHPNVYLVGRRVAVLSRSPVAMWIFDRH